MKESQPLPYQPKTDQVSIEVGLCVLLATDQGDLLGRDFITWLRKQDDFLTNYACWRQKRGLKVRTPIYRRRVNIVRSKLKNEVSRCLNRIVEIHKPKKIVVEKLDFKKMKLSRQMQRLMSNFGKGRITKKLEQLSQEFGIIITHVHAAYSSLTCSDISIFFLKFLEKKRSIFWFFVV